VRLEVELLACISLSFRPAHSKLIQATLRRNGKPVANVTRLITDWHKNCDLQIADECQTATYFSNSGGECDRFLLPPGVNLGYKTPALMLEKFIKINL